MAKYKVKRMRTDAVILDRCRENGELAGKIIPAKECEAILGETYEAIKARECPSRYTEGKPKAVRE